MLRYFSSAMDFDANQQSVGN